MKALLALAFVALLTACAGPTTQPVAIDKAAEEAEARLQRDLAFEGFLEDELRVKKVAQPILVAAVDLCKDKTRYDSGATFISAGSFGKDFEPTVGQYLKISGNELGFLHVIPDSPADKAGLKRGDKLVSINGWSIPNTKDAAAELGKRAAEWLKTPSPLITVVSRTGSDNTSQTIQAIVTPVKACDFPAFLVMQESLNAFADGKSIGIFRGMLRFANDNELALVIGHELAHNFMGHIEASQRNNLLGSIAEIIAASKGVPTQGTLGAAIALAYSPAFEAEADYVGLYVLARAGFDIKDAPKFWRRWPLPTPPASANAA